MSRNLRLTIEYDGTDFHGWQLQPGLRTVQEELEKAIGAILHEPVRLIAASRTDAGVHARGQVAHFSTGSTVQPFKLLGSLNQTLPKDITVCDVQESPQAFHARHDAKGKWYRYSVLNKKWASALSRQHFLHVYEALDMQAMEEAAAQLLGTHDFSSFGVNSGQAPESTVKTLTLFQITGQEEEIHFDIVGNAFLYKMVRSLVGTLLDIGKGNKSPSNMYSILEKKDRCAAGPTVAPHGLYLMKVYYEDLLQHPARPEAPVSSSCSIR